ncbi:MAG TPA: MFS transporter, partial [Trueperaceae bacterium]
GELGWRTVFLWGAGVVALAASVIVIGGRNAPPGVAWRTGDPSASGFAAIVRDHRFWRIAFLNLATVGTTFAVQGLWGGPYLTDLYAFGDLQVGNALVGLGIGVVAGNLACGWLADRLGRSSVVVVSATVFVATQVLLAMALPAAPVSAIYLVFGLSSAYFVVLAAEVRAIFPLNLTGRALTGINFFGMAGAMVVQWLMGIMIGAGSGVAGYRVAFTTTAALAAVALVVYLPGTRLRESKILAHDEA